MVIELGSIMGLCVGAMNLISASDNNYVYNTTEGVKYGGALKIESSARWQSIFGLRGSQQKEHPTNNYG